MNTQSQQLQDHLAAIRRRLGTEQSRLARHIVVLLGSCAMQAGVLARDGGGPTQVRNLLIGNVTCLKELAIHIGMTEPEFDELLNLVLKDIRRLFEVTDILTVGEVAGG